MCHINNCKLPNKVRNIAKYNHKAFCGTYSHDGTKLLTACQGLCSGICILYIKNIKKKKKTLPGREGENMYQDSLKVIFISSCAK
jgi:hypothetical protein